MTEPSNGIIWKLIATSLASLLAGLVMSWFASTTVLDSKFLVVETELKAANEKLDEQKRTTDYQAAKITDLEIDLSTIVTKLQMKSRVVDGSREPQ